MINNIDADFWAELAQIQAESIGWQPLEPGVYLHVSDENATEVLVVGMPQAGAGGNDVITGGNGNDQVTDAVAGSVNVDLGAGDDTYITTDALLTSGDTIVDKATSIL